MTAYLLITPALARHERSRQPLLDENFAVGNTDEVWVITLASLVTSSSLKME